MIKVIFGFKRRSGMSHREFRDYRQNVHAPRLFAIPEAAKLRRFAISYAQPTPNVPEPRFDAIVEAWFDSLADMDAFYLSENFKTKVAPDHANFIEPGSGWKLVTEEVVDIQRP
jgi:uncharacterized protein (TIGR02118 family)